jgi:hypothetical protein
MAISREILNQIKFDFYTGADNETLTIDQTDPFWDWFMTNAGSYSPCEGFDTYYTGQNAIAGNCFGNSQKVSIQEGINYCEGFCKVNGIFILHGFNILDDCVIDSTVQSNPDSFRDRNRNLPTEYYGVIIPNELIEIAPEGNEVEGYLNRASKIFDFFSDN